MARVELNDRARSPRFWLTLAVALLLGGIAVKVANGPDGDKSDPWPTPWPTVVTGTVTPSPLCDSTVPMGQCWETEDEVGPPWYWRESPRVWITNTGVNK